MDIYQMAGSLDVEENEFLVLRKLMCIHHANIFLNFRC